jgi:hypothetical protein
MRLYLKLLIFVFVALQLSLTLKQTNLWPFCSYSLFSYIPPKKMKRTKIKVHLKDSKTEVLSLSQTIPLEFIKSASLYRQIFLYGSSEQKIQFSSLILNSLNNENFNSPLKAYSIKTFTNLNPVKRFELFYEYIDFSNFEELGKYNVSKPTIIFSSGESQ